MALDSIFSSPVIPLAHGSTDSSTNSSTGIDATDNSAAAANGLQTNGSAHSANGSGSSNGKSNKGPGSGDASGSASTTGSDSTSRSGSRGASAAGTKSNSTASSRSKHGSSSQAQSDKTSSTSGTSAGKAAGNKGNAKARQGDDAPPTFMQAMAQTQAAQVAAAQAATTPATASPGAAPADTDASDDATAALGKAKSGLDSASDSSSPATLAFMSQSVAAAFAGTQQPNAAQAINATAANSTDEDASTEAISVKGGSSSAATGLAANLAQQTAAALKAATDPANGSGGSKGNSGNNSDAGADGTSAAVSAFQAHMSVGSHFQQVAAPDSDANKLNSPVGSPAWNDELGGKITWLANQGIQSASVQLSPEHLGPVSVHISVQEGSASVSFTATHADTRAALEQALPRLREMFATNGLTLSDANVSHQSPRGQAQKQSIAAIGGVRGGRGEDATSSTVTPVIASRLGLVDTYA